MRKRGGNTSSEAFKKHNFLRHLSLRVSRSLHKALFSKTAMRGILYVSDAGYTVRLLAINRDWQSVAPQAWKN